MGNKLNKIRSANILLEQRYLQEQGATTGTTQTTGTTGSTQTTSPQTIPIQTKQPSTDGVTEKDIKAGKYPKCVGTQPKIKDIGSYSVHNNNGSICIG